MMPLINVLADMPTDYPFSDDFDWDIELKSKDAAIRACAAIADNNCVGTSSGIHPHHAKRYIRRVQANK
jgi:hypothetical protein